MSAAGVDAQGQLQRHFVVGVVLLVAGAMRDAYVLRTEFEEHLAGAVGAGPLLAKLLQTLRAGDGGAVLPTAAFTPREVLELRRRGVLVEVRRKTGPVQCLTLAGAFSVVKGLEREAKRVVTLVRGAPFHTIEREVGAPG